MGELRKGLVVSKVCATVNISSEVVWNRTHVFMQSVVECKIRWEQINNMPWSMEYAVGTGYSRMTSYFLGENATINKHLMMNRYLSWCSTHLSTKMGRME